MIASEILGPALLGLIQGLTEFLPVSSSGHLVLAQQFFDIGNESVLFDLMLHLGTLIPVLWFYRASILGIARDAAGGEGPVAQRSGIRLLMLIVLASIPTGIIGILFEDTFEHLFANPAALTVSFAITGLLLFSTRGRDQGAIGVADMPFWMALAIGIAQGIAITPGISRSGTTIAVGLLLGLKREFAAELSFLLSVPAILGAILLKVSDVGLNGIDPMQVLVGGGVAMITGTLALHLLVRLVRGGVFSAFAPYCWFAAIVAGVLAWR